VVADRFQSNDDDGRVIRFRPRMGKSRGNHRGVVPIGNSGPDYSPVPDLAKYQDPEGDDEYRHRMTVNAIAAVYTGLLILAGAWLTFLMAHA
jgi:hypothetical protein